MKFRKTILGAGIVLFFAVLASVPFFSKGYIPTHDGEYHIIRFIEFFRMISSGYWFPRWAPTLNSGYGIPIFLFHYPFPNYIGTFFQGAGFNAVEAFKLSLATGYILSGIFSYFWLKKLFGVKAGVVGSIISLFVPYWFVDLYVRGSVGEVWAITFIYAALMLIEYKKLILFSFTVAGLMLSHNILSMLFIPFLLGYSLLRNKRYIIGIIFGILLSSYFWIPAIVERGYVIGLNIVDFKEHFTQVYELIIPSWGTALSGEMFGGNKMSFQIGILPLFVIFGSLIFFMRENVRAMKTVYRFFMITFAVSAFLTLSWSLRLWQYIPVLQYVQYPWRFLSFIIPVAGFFGAYISYHTRIRFLSVILILLSVGLSYSYARPVVYAPRDNQYYLSRKNFTDGTSSMGNSFSTIWSGWKDKRSEYVLEVLNGKVNGDFIKNSYLKKEFSVITEDGAKVLVPILYYPGWQAYIDKKETLIDYQKDGTIQFAIPSGNHQVEVLFTQTITRKCSDALSILTLVWLIGWGILGVYEYRYRRISSQRQTH